MARLMAMENVDAAMRHKVELLHEAGFDCAHMFEKYLKERSRTYGNTKTTRFQFHIAASVKGQLMSADELTDFARQLMAQAGHRPLSPHAPRHIILPLRPSRMRSRQVIPLRPHRQPTISHTARNVVRLISVVRTTDKSNPPIQILNSYTYPFVRMKIIANFVI